MSLFWQIILTIVFIIAGFLILYLLHKKEKI